MLQQTCPYLQTDKELRKYNGNASASFVDKIGPKPQWPQIGVIPKIFIFYARSKQNYDFSDEFHSCLFTFEVLWSCQD